MSGKSFVSVDFEVHGKVQGVYFRKHTQQQARSLCLKGWCMNTSHGTVVGNIQGASDKILKMKHWLRHKGSPKSQIDRADFTNEVVVNKCSYEGFLVKK